MFGQRSGSILCYRCGRINAADAAVCFYCGARRPGLWGLAPGLLRVVRGLDVSGVIIGVSVVAYLASLALDPRALLHPQGAFGILAPSGRALDSLGMTGAYAWAEGRWWTLLTAIYLHGSLLHILFNLLWVRQLAPPVEAAYGWARLALLFTAGGVAGFVASNLAGVGFTVGASGAVFGLLGALVCYGRSRGGGFGAAVFRQYGQWALVIFAMGFFLPGVNNLAHAGGFAGGYLAALGLGSGPERPAHRRAAAAVAALTALAFGLALRSAFFA